MSTATAMVHPRSAPARDVAISASTHRITIEEMVWFTVAAVLLAVSSLDAVSEIPPLADDYWMMASAAGEIAREYIGDYGWGRFLGIWLVDVLNTVRAFTGVPLLAVILVMRVLVLATIYFTLRRVYAFGPGVSLLSVGLMAWNPPASEAWVMLCNLHLAVSVIPVLVACGFYARALGSLRGADETDARFVTANPTPWQWVTAAAIAQLVANFMYEQALLAVPAFVAVLAVLGRGRARPHLLRFTTLGVATGIALVSALVMFATGYVARRSAVATSPAAELSDLGSALNALWVGFGQHHFWRTIEAMRTQKLWWWDASLLGVVAGVATVAASVIIARQILRDRSPRASSPNLGVAAAALAAVYTALLPMGLAYPGYTIISRLYYLPGAFIALAVAALALPTWRVPRLALGLGVGAAMFWLGTVTRRYYEDMRQGSRILRVVAQSIARIPSAMRTGGLLVIAPSNVGTFSTSAVEPWSLRPAVRELTGVNPEGPLLLVTDCAELKAEHPRIHREAERARPRIDGGAEPAPRWAAVLRYQSGSAHIAPSVALACGP